ncbi:MAG: YihY/virulence factor BrkB family protein, partial [Halofilum sp. (in: g-proteobacteria)]
MASTGAQHGRGRESRQPTQIPARGWTDVFTRVIRQQGEDNLSIVAAGVAFYALLALLPALTAAISVYALVADPAQVQQQVQGLAQLMPDQAQRLVSNELGRIASSSGGAIGVGLIGGLLVAFWSASKGTKSLLTALNIAYNEHEDRGFLRFNAIGLGLTVVLVLGAVLAIGLVVALPIALTALGLGGWAGMAVSLARWVILGVGVIAALAVLYRFGPSRQPAEWSWVTPGSIAATVLWLVASILFSIYVANFGNYNATYGTLGAVILLLLWFQISAYIVLLGAEINSE